MTSLIVITAAITNSTYSHHVRSASTLQSLHWSLTDLESYAIYSPQSAFHSILCTRLLLHIREAASPSQKSASLTPYEGTPKYPTTPRPPRLNFANHLQHQPHEINGIFRPHKILVTSAIEIESGENEESLTNVSIHAESNTESVGTSIDKTSTKTSY